MHSCGLTSKRFHGSVNSSFQQVCCVSILETVRMLGSNEQARRKSLPIILLCFPVETAVSSLDKRTNQFLRSQFLTFFTLIPLFRHLLPNMVLLKIPMTWIKIMVATEKFIPQKRKRSFLYLVLLSIVLVTEQSFSTAATDAAGYACIAQMFPS